MTINLDSQLPRLALFVLVKRPLIFVNSTEEAIDSDAGNHFSLSRGKRATFPLLTTWSESFLASGSGCGLGLRRLSFFLAIIVSFKN